LRLQWLRCTKNGHGAGDQFAYGSRGRKLGFQIAHPRRDPTRFARSRSAGAYLGLITSRYASGEIDWIGRISKCGDAMVRSYLCEAANVLLTRQMVVSQGLGPAAHQAQQLAESKSRRSPQAGRHSAPDIGGQH
jgi:transposase